MFSVFILILIVFLKALDRQFVPRGKEQHDLGSIRCSKQTPLSIITADFQLLAEDLEYVTFSLRDQIESPGEPIAAALFIEDGIASISQKALPAAISKLLWSA